MRFSMIDGQKEEIACAISTSAMDNLENLARSKPNEREARFMRLRDRIEERAARKFLAMEFEGTPPDISCAVSISKPSSKGIRHSLIGARGHIEENVRHPTLAKEVGSVRSRS
jgi:hypothetical protein